MQSNKPQTPAGQVLAPYFESRIESLITKRGIYPFPLMILTSAGLHQVKVEGMDMKALETFFRACSEAHEERGVQAAMFGLDRIVTPEQRLECDSVLTCWLYERADRSSIPLIQARDCFRFGVIAYQHKPRIVKPIVWDNPFWLAQMRSEMEAMIPNVVVHKGKLHLHSLTQ
jgi:hypothetical protein